MAAYVKTGYTLVEVPNGPVDARVEFMLERVRTRGTEVEMRPIIVVFAAFAMAFSALATADEFLIGPWRLGMSKEEVMSFAQFQPYVAVPNTGGVETANGIFLGERRNVSFVFDDRGLKYIQASEYQGANFEEAGDGVLRIFDFFEKSLGGATIDGVDLREENAATKLDHAVLKLLIAETLGTAEERGEKAREGGQAMTMFFNMRPVQQPDGSRLHSQWGYASRYKTFYVFLYQDRPSNTKRGTASIVSFEKL